MIIREINANELNSLLELYTHLHELGIPDNNEHLKNTWDTICNDNNNYLVYNPLAFEIVKHFIENINLLPQNIIPKNIDPILLDFLNENNFQQALENMNQNSCNQSTFNKRFYTWFDAFRLLKFLNFAHSHYIEKIPIETAAVYIASKLFPTKQIPTTATELLIFYRQFL